MKRNAFTLTETLLMVAVIGIIAVISAVSLKNMTPDKDVVMIRKAYTDISKAVAVLVNDQNLYPYANVAMNCIDSKLIPLSLVSAVLLCANESLTVNDRENLVDDLESSFDEDCSGGSSSSSTTSYSTTTGTNSIKLAVCYATQLTDGTCEVGQSSYYFCNANCTHTCVSDANSYYDDYGNLICVAPCSSGQTWNSTTNACTSSSSGLSSKALITSSGSSNALITSSSSGSSSLDVDDVLLDFSNEGEDINKGSGSLSSGSNLKDGTYDDKSYSAESTGGAVELNAHGSVFLNTTVMNGSTKYTSSNKFAYNFGKLFKSDDLSCSGNVCTFTTPDGMSWKITDNFANSSKNALILVDINGDIKPNSSTDYYNPDQYTFEVDASGSVTVRGTDIAAEKAKRVLKDRKAKK